jgi:hypothetical protein
MKNFLFLLLIFICGCSPQPQGTFRSWRQWESPSRHERVQAWQFDNGWFEDLNHCPSPFDRNSKGEGTNLVPLSKELLEEVKLEENK